MEAKVTKHLLIDITANGVATVTINRPDVMNAFDEAVIAELTTAFEFLRGNAAVRAILLRGEGKAFCAGADADWMRRAAEHDHDANIADAMNLARMLRAVRLCPKPTIAIVHGPTYGGGVGLVAACDIAIATTKARFCLSEVRLGLIPATIAPHVIDAIGERACRRYFLTAEVFDATRAAELGLVSEVTEPEAVNEIVNTLVARLLEGGPAAHTASKELLEAIAGEPFDEDLLMLTAERIAAARASAEGREGIAAFLEKRQPRWREVSGKV